MVNVQQNGNTITVAMSSNVVIEKGEYSWNDGVTCIIEGNSSADLTQDLTIPAGDNNVFKLTVTDTNGKTKDFEATYSGQPAADVEPPVIELTPPSDSNVDSGAKLQITAKTTTSTILSYMTYQWDNGEETKIEPTDDQTTITATVDIPDGSHTITVVAVKENGVDATGQGTYTSVKKPQINVTQDGNYLDIKITDDKAVTAADITLNGKAKVLTPDRFGGPVVEVNIEMNDSDNSADSTDSSQNTYTLIIKATNQDGATQEFSHQYYTN